MIFIATGPTVTTNSDGRMQKKIGKISFTPSLAAFSSATWRALNAHEVGVGAQALRHAGAEAVGLNQHRHQLLQIVHAGAFGQIAQGFDAAFAGLQLQVHECRTLR